MPWDVKRDDRCPAGKPFGVIKAGGELEGCHATREKARAQQAALYASEEKEMDETQTATADVEVVYDDEKKMMEMAGGPTTFAELEALEDAREAAMEAEELTHKFQMLAGNIVHSPEVEDKAAALSALATEYTGLVQAAMKAKEADALKATWSTAMVNDFPDSSFLHVLSGGEKDGEGKTKPRSLRLFPYKDASGKVDLPHLRNAIARIPQSNRIDAATKKRLQTKARNILQKNQGKERRGIVERVKDFFTKDEDAEPPNTFMVWKEAEAWRWFAVYSNNYRDSDNPPEIISSAAHEEFVDAVDKGEWPHPELWLWHVPGSRVGYADWLAYDADAGFALAAGAFDPGREGVAKALSESDVELLTSHGMPRKELTYDEQDKTIITRYRSREISPLPAWAAANKWNPTFNVMTEVKSMAIPDKKRDFLESLGLDAESIEAQLAGRKEQLDGAGVESKEVEEETTEETEVKEEETVAAVAETETAEEPEAAEEPFGLEQLADTISGAINAAIEPLAQRIEALEGKEAERAVEAEEKQAEPETPLMALGQLLKSRVIGAQEARVDGRTKEANDGPQETEPASSTPLRSGNPLADATVSRLLAGKTWQELGRLEN